MGVIDLPKRESVADAPGQTYRRGRSARLWYWTAGSRMALVLLATVRIVAQHFIVHQKGGLRTYSEVLTYISNPVIFVLEAGFLLAVTIHAMLGIRSILHDLDLSHRATRRLDRALWALGSLTVLYGAALLITLTLRS